MRALHAAALLAMAGAAGPVIAQNNAIVTLARAAGQVGERYDGYLGLAAETSLATRQQVSAINIKRRSLYTQLATQRGAAPGDVGITAGCELLARVAVGEAYQLADNQWRRRDPGEAAPVPDYCRP